AGPRVSRSSGTDRGRGGGGADGRGVAAPAGGRQDVAARAAFTPRDRRCVRRIHRVRRLNLSVVIRSGIRAAASPKVVTIEAGEKNPRPPGCPAGGAGQAPPRGGAPPPPVRGSR